MTTASPIIGPYSPWRPKPKRPLKRPAILAGSTAFVAVFLHCGLPMIL